MHFQDTAQIEIQAGPGGNGIVSWRKEKFASKGGPFGGDGGKGGDVIFKTNPDKNTLADFRATKHWKAESGDPGQTQTKHGKNGADLVIQVPLGTMIFDGAENLLADLTKPDQIFLASSGGRGGFGNAHFTSSTRQTPNFAELGEPTQPFQISLELRLVADIGIIGLPSAGKSTLISRLSNAKPKIADYPFTTLIPNLGVCETFDEPFVLCDIPGLIEGASEGRGLGHEFLRHIERCGALCHVIDASHDDPVSDWKIIRNELKKFSQTLDQKPEIIALNKIDLNPDFPKIQKALEKTTKLPIFPISAVTGEGLKSLTTALQKAAKQDQTKRQELQIERNTRPQIFQPHLQIDSNHWEVISEKDGFRISGPRIEQLGIMTNWDQIGGQERFADILHKKGIDKVLTKAGWTPDQPLIIGQKDISKLI